MLGRPAVASVVGAVVFLDVSGSGRAREVRQRFAGQQVTGHQVESFMSACVDARVPLLLFDLFRASPCWLAALWLLQVQANLVAFRVLPMLQNGVSVLGSRWGGQPACFALSRLRLFLFEARLSGYCVREGGGVKGVNPGCL